MAFTYWPSTALTTRPRTGESPNYYPNDFRFPSGGSPLPIIQAKFCRLEAAQPKLDFGGKGGTRWATTRRI